MTGLLHSLAILFRNLGDLELLAERFVVEDVLLALDDVDVAGERLSAANRELDRVRVLGEAILDHAQAAIKVGADTIHFVGEDESRNLVAVGLAPDGLRLGLDTGDRIQKSYRAVEHAQRSLDFHREVDVTRRVDDVDAILGA